MQELNACLILKVRLGFTVPIYGEHRIALLIGSCCIIYGQNESMMSTKFSYLHEHILYTNMNASVWKINNVAHPVLGWHMWIANNIPSMASRELLKKIYSWDLSEMLLTQHCQRCLIKDQPIYPHPFFTWKSVCRWIQVWCRWFDMWYWNVRQKWIQTARKVAVAKWNRLERLYRSQVVLLRE